jgi:hypothetical protein
MAIDVEVEVAVALAEMGFAAVVPAVVVAIDAVMKPLLIAFASVPSMLKPQLGEHQRLTRFA